MDNQSKVSVLKQRVFIADTADVSAMQELTKGKNSRILLAVNTPGNKARLREHLIGHYDVVEPIAKRTEFARYDLAVVDASGYQQWREVLLETKLRYEPIFLPTVLILNRAELQRVGSRDFWDLVDEFVVAPIDKLELSERVAMLLRARNLSLSQEEHLAYLASHDRVTGLANHYRFKERLSEVVVDASVLNQTVQVLVIKFGLSRVMSSFGHSGMDKAAIICSNRLKQVLGPGAFLARLTTDTWGVLQPPGQPVEQLMDVCQRVKGLGDLTLDVHSERVHVVVKQGVGIYPQDATDATGTLDAAINAIASATDAVPRFYSKTAQHEALRYIRTEARLREALSGDQFELWYQPQIRLEDGALAGVEALIRWRLPNGHLAPPGDFLSVAESTGLIVPIDRWVIREACRVMCEWQKDKLPVPKIAINVTAADVNQADFSEYVREQLTSHCLRPPMLEIELTESTLFECTEDNLKQLGELRDYGIDIAIDDFGTGYSSLSYLHKLPISVLKVDQSFVRNVLTVETDAAIVKTIIWLAKNFRLATVAEGIETEMQAQYLKAADVDFVQGFFYARPMPEEQFRQWLVQRNAQPMLKLK
ncbi:MAG: bifunctional diguanylate cyclase/phosphodiesterase [Pseudohongiellaceae bacterium]